MHKTREAVTANNLIGALARFVGLSKHPVTCHTRVVAEGFDLFEDRMSGHRVKSGRSARELLVG